MRRRARIRLGLVLLGFVAIVATASRNAVAVDGGAGAACQLPTGLDVTCTTDADCAIYNAICNVHKFCECASAGGGTDMSHASDGGGGAGSGGSGGGFSGGTGSSAPIHGGGMTFAPRSGCSSTPGER
jgi:hypothetical protein